MSSVQELCRKTYRDFIENEPWINTELRRALRTHERVPVFVDNLAREFTQMTFEAKRDDVIQAVRDLTRWFIIAVEQTSQERIMSPLEKAVKKAREQEKEEFRKEAEALEKQGTFYVSQDEKGETHTQEIAFEG